MKADLRRDLVPLSPAAEKLATPQQLEAARLAAPLPVVRRPRLPLVALVRRGRGAHRG